MEIKQFTVDQFGLRFSEIIIRADFGKCFFFNLLFFYFFIFPWEYNHHLLSKYLPNVSSWIVSTDVLAAFFVLLTQEKNDKNGNKNVHCLDFRDS